MPIFEYTCNQCRRTFSALVGVVANASPPACPRCGSDDLKKLVSRFARVRSEDEAMDALADAADSADLDDPRTLRRFMKEMGKGMDDEMGGEDVDEMIEQAMDDEASGESAGDTTTGGFDQ